MEINGSGNWAAKTETGAQGEKRWCSMYTVGELYWVVGRWVIRNKLNIFIRPNIGLLHTNIGLQFEYKKYDVDILIIQCNPVQMQHTRNRQKSENIKIN